MNFRPRQRPRRDAAASIPEFQDPWDELLLDTRIPIDAHQADCCVATATHRVVLPAGESRARPAELLLCGHHFRASRDGLRRASATAFDAQDQLCSITDER